MKDRYQRNRNLISVEEQKKLANTTVAVIGLGSLGGYIAEQLARLGIGRLVLLGMDRFEESNLDRQIFSTETNLGLSKAEQAGVRLNQVNSELQYNVYPEALTQQNAEEILKGAQIVLDGLDNIRTRFLLGDACMK